MQLNKIVHYSGNWKKKFLLIITHLLTNNISQLLIFIKYSYFLIFIRYVFIHVNEICILAKLKSTVKDSRVKEPMLKFMLGVDSEIADVSLVDLLYIKLIKVT